MKQEFSIKNFVFRSSGGQCQSAHLHRTCSTRAADDGAPDNTVADRLAPRAGAAHYDFGGPIYQRPAKQASEMRVQFKQFKLVAQTLVRHPVECAGHIEAAHANRVSVLERQNTFLWPLLFARRILL